MRDDLDLERAQHAGEGVAKLLELGLVDLRPLILKYLYLLQIIVELVELKLVVGLKLVVFLFTRSLGLGLATQFSQVAVGWGQARTWALFLRSWEGLGLGLACPLFS